MSRQCSNFLDFGIEEEIDPKIKFNSLISVTVSTIMCVAARCPLPKSNIETTKLFLRTITDEKGQTPRNIKGFLTLLNNYSGPYEPSDNSHYEKPILEKPIREKAILEKPIKEIKEKSPPAVEPESMTKPSGTQLVTREGSTLLDSHSLLKRPGKSTLRRNEKDPKKTKDKPVGKITPSKSLITKF